MRILAWWSSLAMLFVLLSIAASRKTQRLRCSTSTNVLFLESMKSSVRFVEQWFHLSPSLVVECATLDSFHSFLRPPFIVVDDDQLMLANHYECISSSHSHIVVKNRFSLVNVEECMCTYWILFFAVCQRNVLSLTDHRRRRKKKTHQRIITGNLYSSSCHRNILLFLSNEKMMIELLSFSRLLQWTRARWHRKSSAMRTDRINFTRHADHVARRSSAIFDFRRLQTDVSSIIWLTSVFFSIYQRFRDTWTVNARATEQQDGRWDASSTIEIRCVAQC